NGGLKFTGVVDKTEIDMTAGMTPLNTVEMTSCVVPEDMKIAEQIGISHEAAVAVKKQASYFAGQKITGEAYGDKGMVTIHRGVGETGEVNYGTDGTYIGKEGGIARLYAAVDEDKGVLNIARVSGDTEAAIELGAPAEMVAAATSPGKQTHFGSAKIEDTVYINDNIISFSVSAAPDQTGEYAFLVSGGGCDEQMEFTAAWTNSRFEIIEADVSLNLINNPDSGLNLPDTVIDSANTGKTYIGGMGETETNMGLLEMSLETFGQEAVTRINNADYVNADSKVKIFLGQDDGATTYGLAGVGRTSEGDLNIISMLNTDTNKMELAHVHGDTDAMRSFGVPSVLVDKIELGNVWVGSEKYENVQFVRGNGVATIDIARETATGNTRFMIQGSKDGGLVFAEIKAEFISFSAGNQVMIDSKPVILTEAMGNPQAIMLKGDKGFMLDMGVSEAEIKGLDGSAKILAGNRVDYIAGGEYEIRVSENSVDGKAVFSPIGVIETDEGNIMVMAGMTGDEMKVQTASGSKVAFGAAGIGEELLGYLAAGEGQTYKGLKIIYEQDGMVNLQFTEDGDKLSGIIKLESGETLQVTTGIKTKNVANKPDHWVHGITVVPYVVDVVTNGLTVSEAIGLQVESLSGTDAALKDAGITVQNEHKFHYTQHGERIKYSNNGIYTIVLGDGQELVAGTVLMNLEDGQAEVSVLTGVTGIKTAFINGKSIGATDEGTLMLGVVGDKISIRNTQTNTYRLYNSAGVKKTGWLTRVHNTQYEAFIGLSNAWESGHKHGAEFRTNFLAGKGWAALDSGYRIVSCAFAVIGNAAMGGIMWTLAPVTSGLDYLADNHFRNQGAMWIDKSLYAVAYFGAKFVSQNLMLIAIIGASLVCPAVGMAFLGVMAMAEMTKGFVGGFVATISNFFIHPFTEFVHGISLLWHNSYSVTNAFNVADNMLVLSAGALGIFFAFMMGAHAYRIVKPTAQIIAVGFLGRVLDITYRSKSEFKPESGRVREILLSEKSYYQKGIELRNLYKEAKVKGKENEAVEGKGVGEVGPQRTGEPKGTGGIRREVVLEGSTLRTAKDIMLELNKPVEIGTGKGGLLTLELTGKTGTTGKTTINVKVDPKTGDVTLRVEGGKPVIIESGGKLPEIRISDGQLVSIRQVPSEVVFLEGRVTGASNAIRNAKTPGEALMAGLKHTRAMENLAQGLRTKGADIQAESVMRAAKSGDALGAKLLTKLMENPAAETMKLVESLEKTAEAKKDGKKSRDQKTGTEKAQEILAETGRSIGRNPAMARTMFKNNLVSKTMAESMFKEYGKGKSSEHLVMEIGKSSEAAGNLFKALEGTKSESAVEMIIKRAAEMDNKNSVQRQTLNLDQGSRLMRNILAAARQDSNLANKIYDLAAKDSKVLDSAARHLASVAEGKNGLITKVRNLRRRPKDLSEAISREAMSKLERYVDAAEKATLKAD
ncbi:hypothetical protein KAR10_06980, partial [bacterium]|nr:hypothetical protein [bacterium]